MSVLKSIIIKILPTVKLGFLRKKSNLLEIFKVYSIGKKINQNVEKKKINQKNSNKNVEKKNLKFFKQKNASVFFSKIISYLVNPILAQEKVKELFKVMDLYYKEKKYPKKVLRKLFIIIEPFLTLTLFPLKKLICHILKKIGLSLGLINIVANIRKVFKFKSKKMENLKIKIFTIILFSDGISCIIPFLRPFCLNKKMKKEQIIIYMIIRDILENTKYISNFNLKSIIYLIGKCLESYSLKIKCLFGNIVPLLVKANINKKINELSHLIPIVFHFLKNTRGKIQIIFLRSSGYLLNYFKKNIPYCFLKKIFDVLVIFLKRKEQYIESVCLKILKILLSFRILKKKLSLKFFFPFFKRILSGYFFGKKKIIKQSFMRLIDILVQKIDNSKLFFFLIRKLHLSLSSTKKIVFLILEKIIHQKKFKKMNSIYFSQLLDALVYELKEYSTKELSEENKYILIKIHNIIEIICRKFSSFIKPYLSRIAGILKWELRHKKSILRNNAAKTLSKIYFIFEKNKKINLIRNLFFVLLWSLGEKKYKILIKILNGARKIIKVFFSRFFLFNLNQIFFYLIPLFKIRKISFEEELVKFLSVLISKKYVFLPEKDWHRVCLGVLEILDRNNFNIKKLCIACLSKIGKIIGPLDLAQILFEYLNQKKKKNVSISIILLTLTKMIGSPVILIRLLIGFVKSNLYTKLCILRTFSFIIKNESFLKIDNYIHAFQNFLEIVFLENFREVSKIFFILICQLFQKLKNIRFEFALSKFLKMIWIEIIFSKGVKHKLLVFAISKIFSVTYEEIFPKFFILGTFHPKKKIKNIYWKFILLVTKKIYSLEFFDPFFSLKRLFFGQIII
ncbi:splicing factor 3b subunit 1 (nucleomorph) [Chroomonas mesostigmatica CCMP1168]|uniref:Splicing factor 3b subunit 1 n=1 Tax=Chroomonas mesostigmatica CCMP1168 TaxID=1195612 RepID=J7G875_9CRYP|nr:splicing factor 3b subunit 1 [Chroomonas mesostigmatica CCMP1168]